MSDWFRFGIFVRNDLAKSNESGNIAGIANILDIGMVAGSNYQKSSMVRFEDFQLWVEE